MGVLRHADLKEAAATGPGNQVILFGSLTGPDGIGGASVLASASFGGSGEGAKRPSVQVGDPFMEKLLVECCLELYQAGLVVGIQDLGAAGVACATTELAAGGGTGMRVRLDSVPLRDASLGPAEILMSESQERMMAIVTPADVAEFLAICAKWDVPATVIGEVTGTGRLEMTWHGDRVVDIPPGSAADDGPLCDRPVARPASQDQLLAGDPAQLPRPAAGAELRADLLLLLGSAEGGDKAWVTEQYDRYVRGDTVLAMPEDAGLLRVDAETGLGVALATDGNGRYCLLDPYAGTQLALAEAYRNVAVTGARPLAVTNCLNFGSPEDPAVMWQFTESVRGLADGCRQLGVPVTGGNVSFYNQTGGTAIQPTPVIGVLGVHGDVRRRVRSGFREAGGRILLLGETSAEFGGSLWAWLRHRQLAGHPPSVDLDAERALAELLVTAQRSGICCWPLMTCPMAGSAWPSRNRAWPAGPDASCGCQPTAATFLFSESAGRAVVVVRPDAEADVSRCARRPECQHVAIGETGGAEPGGRGAVLGAPDRACAGAFGPRCRRCSAEPLRPTTTRRR